MCRVFRVLGWGLGVQESCCWSSCCPSSLHPTLPTPTSANTLTPTPTLSPAVAAITACRRRCYPPGAGRAGPGGRPAGDGPRRAPHSRHRSPGRRDPSPGRGPQCAAPPPQRAHLRRRGAAAPLRHRDRQHPAGRHVRGAPRPRQPRPLCAAGAVRRAAAPAGLGGRAGDREALR